VPPQNDISSQSRISSARYRIELSIRPAPPASRRPWNSAHVKSFSVYLFHRLPAGLTSRHIRVSKSQLMGGITSPCRSRPLHCVQLGRTRGTRVSNVRVSNRMVERTDSSRTRGRTSDCRRIVKQGYCSRIGTKPRDRPKSRPQHFAEAWCKKPQQPHHSPRDKRPISHCAIAVSRSDA
jgi:hypothetical protein